MPQPEAPGKKPDPVSLDTTSSHPPAQSAGPGAERPLATAAETATTTPITAEQILRCMGQTVFGGEVVIANLGGDARRTAIAAAVNKSPQGLNKQFATDTQNLFKGSSEKGNRTLREMIGDIETARERFVQQEGTFAIGVEKDPRPKRWGRRRGKYLVAAVTLPDQGETMHHTGDGIDEYRIVIGAVSAPRWDPLRKKLKKIRAKIRTSLEEAGLEYAPQNSIASTIAKHTSIDEVRRIAVRAEKPTDPAPPTFRLARGRHQNLQFEKTFPSPTVVDGVDFTANRYARWGVAAIAQQIWGASNVLREEPSIVARAKTSNSALDKILTLPFGQTEPLSYSTTTQEYEEKIREWVNAKAGELRDNPQSASPEELAAMGLYAFRDPKLKWAQTKLTHALYDRQRTEPRWWELRRRVANWRLRSKGGEALGKQMDRILRAPNPSGSQGAYTLEHLLRSLGHDPIQMYIDKWGQSAKRVTKKSIPILAPTVVVPGVVMIGTAIGLVKAFKYVIGGRKDFFGIGIPEATRRIERKAASIGRT